MTTKERLIFGAAALALGLGGLALGAHAIGSTELALMFGGTCVTVATGVAGAIALAARNGRSSQAPPLAPPPAVLMTREQVRQFRRYLEEDGETFGDETTEQFAMGHGLSLAPDAPEEEQPRPRRREPR